MPLDPAILADRAKYPDTLEIQMGDVKVSLGDLRTYAAAQQMEQQRKFEEQVGQYRQQYQALAENFNAIQSELQRAQQQVSAPQNQDVVAEIVKRLTGSENPNILQKPGEYFQPLVDQIRTLEKSLKEAYATNEALKGDMTKAMAWQLRREMNRDYQNRQWPEGFSVEKALEYATRKGYVNPADNNYPDFDRIHNEVMGPTLREQHEKELRDKYIAEGRKAMEEEFRAKGAVVPTPGFNGGTPALKTKFGGIDKIPEDEAVMDADVFGQMAVQ